MNQLQCKLADKSDNHEKIKAEILPIVDQLPDCEAKKLFVTKIRETFEKV